MLCLNSPYPFSSELQSQFSHITFSQDSNPPQAIISNKKQNCDIYAPEIDWYLKISQAEDEIKLENIDRFFQTRLSIYDHAPFKEYEVQVNSSLLLIGNTNSSLLQDFERQAGSHFEITTSRAEDISHISGQIGAFTATMKDGSEILFAQAVLFVQDETLPKFLGILSISNFENAQEVITLLNSRLGIYTYKTTTLYTPSLCQYHQRRPDKNGEGFCHKCVNVCPSFGVSKDDTLMELSFSQIDCMGCGGCIATCPTGALDFAPFDIDTMIESLRHYKNTKILLIPENFLYSLQELALPPHISPLIIPREKFLSEVHFLSMVQESNHSMIFYSPVISRPSFEAIKLINDIYQAILGKDAIFVAQDTKTLQTLWNLPSPLPHYSYTPSPKEARRKHLAERLMHMIKDEDFGRVKSGESGELIRYGEIQIDENKCTLCNSCVGACNVDSLIANSKDLSLQYNPSLCTTCGYCLPSCPENAISLELNGIQLTQSYFSYKTMAKDTLFGCKECGKPFATTKSIQKIKNLMGSHFANDPIKLKTLECCADCKVKLMFGE